MSETGGPTAQSGILYQNSVAALHLGRMLDVRTRPKRDVVLKVRVEAPSEVDDIVVSYLDEHIDYIQAKERLGTGGDEWKGLWTSFDEQSRSPAFVPGRDRLVLYTGETGAHIRHIDEALERARGSYNSDEWFGRLSAKQRQLIDRIASHIAPAGLSPSRLFDLIRHVHVEVGTLRSIEKDQAPIWMPELDGDRLPIELFRLLRDRAGGHSRYRQSFSPTALRESLAAEKYTLGQPPDVEALRAAAHACGASLRHHKGTFAQIGTHLRRPVVEDLLGWAVDPSSGGKLAMLIDRAGMGKSVVARDLLIDLERAGGATLAMKADAQLSGLASARDLWEALGLPESVEKVVARLAKLGPVVVLIDQVDALSLSLAQDRGTLDMILGMVARLRMNPEVRVLLSCREFDRKSDPRLRDVESHRDFTIPPLSDEEITSTLGQVGIDFAGLSPATRDLLRTPLHLDLFLRVAEVPNGLAIGATPYRGLRTLQDLYAELWRRLIDGPSREAPSPVDKAAVIDRLTEFMHTNQRTTARKSVLDTTGDQHLRPAAEWLASNGVLLDGPSGWAFLHQTFFDYCLARRFVESDKRLSLYLPASEQSLTSRPLLVHVLSYLRGTDPKAYIAEMQKLLSTTGLRPHLKDLLTRWFASQIDISDEEWTVAFRGLLNPATRPKLLSAMSGRTHWLDRLEGEPLDVLLAQAEAVIDAEVMPFLASIATADPGRVVPILSDFLDRGPVWVNRAAWAGSLIRDWRLKEAAELYERVALAVEPFLVNTSYLIDDIAKEHPEIGIRLIRLLLDRVLASFQASRNREGTSQSLSRDLDRLNTSTIDKALRAILSVEPVRLLDSLLHWVAKACESSSYSPPDERRFANDGLSRSWYDTVYGVQRRIIEVLVEALVASSRIDIAEFRLLAAKLAGMPYRTPQALLARAYRSEPERLAKDALAFLLEDRRRLDLGENNQWESRHLIRAIYPLLSEAEREELDRFIVDNPRPISGLGTWQLRSRGFEQFVLLDAIPSELLTERGRIRLDELRRKFPDAKVSDDPRTIHTDWVQSPVPPGKEGMLSDRDWLRLLRRERIRTHRADPFKGGPRELGMTIRQAAKVDPERFANLLDQLTDTEAAPYAWAFVNAFAESNLAPERLYAIMRRFANTSDSELRRGLAWALRDKADRDVPDDLLDTLEAIVRDKSLRPTHESGDPYTGYMNSDRGAALSGLMRGLERKGMDAAKARKWRLIEFIAEDDSTTLRAGAIEELLFLLSDDRERAVTLFEKLMDGHLALYRSQSTGDFLYHGFFKNFGRMKRHIRAFMDDADDEVQQRGAELACIAAVSPLAIESEAELDEARRMAEQALTGLAAWRRGAARVYAANIARNLPADCVQALTRLCDDEDTEVRALVGTVSGHLRGDQLVSLHDFLLRLASSRSIEDGAHPFVQFLWKHWMIAPMAALDLVGSVVEGWASTPMRVRYLDSEKLVRIALRVHTDPSADEQTQLKALDIFDRLLDRFPGEANQVLGEWDRV